MSESEILVLVAFLATNAKSDQTAPPSWLLDTLLKGVEKYVLHGLNLPAVFADICARAAEQVEDAANKLILQLGVINGLRRIAATTDEVAKVKSLFDEVKAGINALPDGPRKERLLSFLQYQAGVFMARNGYYTDAAERQLYAAKEAKTDAERAIADFLFRVYSMWAAVVHGDFTGIRAALQNVVVEYRRLERAVKGTTHEAQWGLGNGPVHIVQAHLYAGLEVSDELWGELYHKVQEAGKQIPAFAEWAGLLTAMGSIQSRREIGGDLLDVIIEQAGDPTALATARLMKARILLAAGKTDEAKAIYASISPAPDCHQVAAVAERELPDIVLV